MQAEQMPLASEFRSVNDDTVRIYQWIVEHGRFLPDNLAELSADLGLGVQECREVIDSLTRLRLLGLEPHGPGLLPIVPDTAIATLLGPAEHELREGEDKLARRRAEITQLRSAISELAPVWFESHRQRRGARSPMEILTEPSHVQALVKQTATEYDSEVWVCRPRSGRYPELLAEDVALAEEGLRIRSLWQHSARFDMGSQAYAEAMTAAGSQVRTTTGLAGPLIVIGDRVSLLPHQGGEGMVVVREPSTVTYLHDAFDQQWEQAVPFQTGPTAAHETAEAIKKVIVVMLFNGLKDEAVAKRVGLSVRACRNHISEIMKRLGASSRFQAGALAVESGLLERLATECPQGDDHVT